MALLTLALTWPVIASAQEPPPLAQPAPADTPAPPELPPASEGPLPSEVPPPPPPIEPEPAVPVLIPQPPPPPTFTGDTSRARKLDLMLPMAASSLVLGGALVLTGAIPLGVGGDDNEYCGFSGCVDRVDRVPDNIAASMIGAGSGFALVGGLGMLAWGVDAPTGTERRRSEPLMVTGYSMTALAGASVGLGIGQGITYDNRETNLETAWPWFLTGGLLSAGGIPLLAIGADNRDAEERAQAQERDRLLRDPAVKKDRKSRGLMAGGIVLTAIGGLGTVAGTGILIADTTQGGPGVFTAVIGLPTWGVGALCSSIGIPLLISGAQKVPLAPEALPTVGLGPGGLQAAWRLP